MTEKELKKLFEQKLEGLDYEFNEANWEAFEQMTDPGQPLSEQEYKKLFRDKMAQATFPFNPANWEAMEAELGPEHGMSDQELQHLFNKKISESEFAFNPDNWNRMEAILDQKAKKPLAFFWRSAAAILIAAGISSVLLWQNQGLNPVVPVNEEVIVNSVVEPSDAPIAAADSPSLLEEPILLESENPEPLSNSSGSIVSSSTADTEIAAQNTYIQDGQALLSGVRPLNKNTAVADIQGPPSSSWKEVALLQPNHRMVTAVGDAPLVNYTPTEEQYVPMRYSKVYALGGTGISQAMNGRVGSPGWQIGLEYEYGWSEKASLRTGLIYAQSGDIGLETLHDSTFFGLGRTEVHTHRHYKNLKTLQIPLAYQYQFAPKHRFGLGLQTDILLSVVMDQTKTTTIFKQDPKVEESHFDQQMNSFEPINFSALLSYQYQYSDRLSLGFSYALALNDITKDHAQDFEADHRPGQANLQLRYRLFEK